ncbi:MAG: hypothetical protein R2722_16770 [Tessaracoccus sp.]
MHDTRRAVHGDRRREHLNGEVVGLTVVNPPSDDLPEKMSVILYALNTTPATASTGR